MQEPMLIQNLSIILFNPYLLTITGIGWVWIIISHFKIHWRIQSHIHYRNTCRKATNDELQDWIKDAKDPRWSSLNTRWNNAIIKEYERRKLTEVTQE